MIFTQRIWLLRLEISFHQPSSTHTPSSPLKAYACSKITLKLCGQQLTISSEHCCIYMFLIDLGDCHFWWIGDMSTHCWGPLFTKTNHWMASIRDAKSDPKATNGQLESPHGAWGYRRWVPELTATKLEHTSPIRTTHLEKSMFRQVARANLGQVFDGQMVQLHCSALFVDKIVFWGVDKMPNNISNKNWNAKSSICIDDI